ncbi:unnamed protein product [Cuscuta europaea]|uniref:HMA domain-containing protein n=1 Tax=Cuscuta europaea TaxID=41803 RepID=A0A9P0ZQ47_CUSEU|nr:unnamed protein product [Cuscuta europaea]
MHTVDFVVNLCRCEGCKTMPTYLKKHLKGVIDVKMDYENNRVTIVGEAVDVNKVIQSIWSKFNKRAKSQNPPPPSEVAAGDTPPSTSNFTPVVDAVNASTSNFTPAVDAVNASTSHWQTYFVQVCSGEHPKF